MNTRVFIQKSEFRNPKSLTSRQMILPWNGSASTRVTEIKYRTGIGVAVWLDEQLGPSVCHPDARAFPLSSVCFAVDQGALFLFESIRSISMLSRSRTVRPAVLMAQPDGFFSDADRKLLRDKEKLFPELAGKKLDPSPLTGSTPGLLDRKKWVSRRAV